MNLLPLILILILPLTGCTTRSKARAEARAAFLAGQNSALRMQPQGLTVTVFGPVRNQFVPWTEDLTLAKAIVAAEYLEQRNPREILIRRNGETLSIPPNMLLNGEDVPLQLHDEIEIHP